MIVGTIYLITILFGGGLIDTFFIAELEKGVKEYVVDDDRRKEITTGIKSAKKSIKSFNKNRKAQFKVYKKMNASRATTSEEFDKFFLQLRTERIEHQGKLIDARLDLAKKIRADEWASIVTLSEETMDKRNEKAQKKADKKLAKAKGDADALQRETLFKKTRKSLDKIDLDIAAHENIVAGLDELVVVLKGLDEDIRAVNVQDNNAISRQDATREELESIAKNVNDLRSIVFDTFISFHFTVKENTSEADWDKFMKAFDKEFQMAVR
jgi:hypothetical protein